MLALVRLRAKPPNRELTSYTGGTRPTIVMLARTRRQSRPVLCTQGDPLLRLVDMQKNLQAVTCLGQVLGMPAQAPCCLQVVVSCNVTGCRTCKLAPLQSRLQYPGCQSPVTHVHHAKKFVRPACRQNSRDHFPSPWEGWRVQCCIGLARRAKTGLASTADVIHSRA